MRTARLILLVIVAGAFVLAGCGGDKDDTEAKMEEAKEDLAEVAENVKEGVEETAEDMKEGIEEKAGEAKEGIEEKTGEAKEGIEEKAGEVKEGMAAKMEEAKGVVDLANAECPICGMDLKGEHRTFTYEGKKVHVCSEHCQESFMKDPEKHMATLLKEVKDE